MYLILHRLRAAQRACDPSVMVNGIAYDIHHEWQWQRPGQIAS
jgi:hypothetical protein